MNIDELFAMIQKRKAENRDGSYVATLLSDSDRLIQKVGEEAMEVVIAAKNTEKIRQIEEMTDLLFHSVVLWASLGIRPEDIYAELEKRKNNKS